MYHLLFYFFLALPVLLLSLRRVLITTSPEGLTCYPIVGNLPQFLANRHRLLDWFTGLLLRSPTHTIFLRRLGNIRGIITAYPANVEHVLRNNFDNYGKGERFTFNLHDFLGQGIFNSDGEQWRTQRKTASFEFTTRSLRNFVVDTVRHETAARLLPLLEEAARDHVAFDLQDVLERFAFDNVCKVAFNTDPAYLQGSIQEQLKHRDDDGSYDFPPAFKQAAFLSSERFRTAIPRLWKIKKLLNIGTERRLGESIATVHQFADNIIQSRREERREQYDRNSNPHVDLLARFMEKTGSSSDRYLRDVVISFLLAGRETTSSVLAWFFWILSTRPDVERKILEELRATRARRHGLHGREMLRFEDLHEMHYLHSAITETLRLYPSVPLNSLTCLEDDVLPDSTKVKKGWFVSYSSYAIGRMKSVWGEDCLEYKPERWLDDKGAFRPESPFKFTAFHAGPRMCLGKEMAYIQMKSVAAHMLERFEVNVLEKERSPEHMLSLTLRMKHGLLVTVKERGLQDST